ncbi:PadR family transcriptional regulator [Virgibacillus sp. NKC19-3]|uniref:PadR family transcriptional regulator n=1 Tax=Virgibacillus saliphilus TaxID=2831674 RepID=UPI001C9A7522|nr:PadR family transcriptional regulator [Virgibacillus sp. NKC19-3]MBY7145107.1 PadR family transcriptional regulator [Virgibacillus sp. NKC19-3]
MKQTNNTKYAILGLLTTGCHTGYAIKQLMDQSLNHFWKISYGQIYPTLKQLVADGLATVQGASQEGKPDKKEYFLTEKGEAKLRAWLQAPINAIATEKNEMLLKLFFSRHQSNEATISQLEQYKEKLHDRMYTYDALEKMITSDLYNKADAAFWLFTLDYGKRTTTAAIEWCTDTIQQIQSWQEE